MFGLNHNHYLPTSLMKYDIYERRHEIVGLHQNGGQRSQNINWIHMPCLNTIQGLPRRLTKDLLKMKHLKSENVPTRTVAATLTRTLARAPVEQSQR